jgi:hypothetical protein
MWHPTRLQTATLMVTVILIGCLQSVVGAAEETKLEPIDIGTPERLTVFPAEFHLTGIHEKSQLVVTGYYADGSTQDLTRVAQFTSSDEGVAVVDSSVVSPKSDGTVTIQISVGGQQTSSVIQVSNQGVPQRRSFEFGALVALSKQGCNSGACHGSPSGKGGFRMSLRAFDSKLDKRTLVQESFGRRVNPLAPEQSLLLQKPTMQLPHAGGLKLRPSDPAYIVLRDWIADGCPLDPADTPRCVKLEVYPPAGRVLKRPAHTQKLAVHAHFADGSVRDVTPLAVFTSSDTAIASIDETGLVVGYDRGEATMLVRYLEHIESTSITFVREIEGFIWNEVAQHNYIDERVDEKLQQLQFVPSGLCSDEEFIRRAHLDIVGGLPTPEEVQTFLADTSDDKRAQLIDGLLERPEYAKYWALKWGDLLRLTKQQVGSDAVYKYHRWIERAIAENMPYDQFATELLTASGSTHSNPAANFYRTATDTNDCVESISQIFMGARLQCAKCHNHPFERWTQDNYYGMAAFFNRVQRKKTPKPDELFIWVSRSGEVTQPRTQQQMLPWLPGKGDVQNVDVNDRRKLFADWLTEPTNPFFGRMEANRIWSHLLGKGIVDPPDDFRDSNPPSNPALLDALAADFAKSGYDRKHLIRTILNSRTYQASSVPQDFNRDDSKYFSHFEPRLLSAEQLLDAICDVTLRAESFTGLPANTRAIHLPAPDLINHEFLKTFGQPERQTVCQCERASESNLGMAIQFFNGKLIFDKLRANDNRFRKLVTAGKDDNEIIGHLYLASVSRQPTERELEATVAHLKNKVAATEQENLKLTQTMVQQREMIAGVRMKVEAALLAEKVKTLPEALRADTEAAIKAADKDRTEVQKYLVQKLGLLVAVTAEQVTAALDEATKKQIADLEVAVGETQKQIKTQAVARIEALEDICWSLLNTNEFLFQH